MTPFPGAEAAATNRDRIAGSEIWLRGNARPAIGLLAAALVVAGGVTTAVVFARPAAWIAWGVVAAAALLVAAAVALAWSASRPRLARRGAFLDVRLSPLAVQHVPIEIVECVFPGSQPLDADDADHEAVAGRRVNTLVLRLAERALDWRSRSVAAAWGTWDEGNVVFDGRWCEPLSPALAREISARLLEARRQVAGAAETRS
ncbi:MAG: hypothetical protein K8S94_06015 [Planctomycetia bacterium]|nr:hypothetical protein [Planctomycetia bacterium]